MPDDTEAKVLGTLNMSSTKALDITFEQSELILRMVEELNDLDRADRQAGITPSQMLDRIAANSEDDHHMVSVCSQLAGVALAYFAERLNQKLDPLNKHGPGTMHPVFDKGDLQ